MKLLKKMLCGVLSVTVLLSALLLQTAAENSTAAEEQKVYFGKTDYAYRLEERNLSDYYEYDETGKSYTRKVKDAAASWEWNYPFICIGSAVNFKLEFDLKLAPGLNKQWLGLVIGAEQNSFGWENGSGAILAKIGAEENFSAEKPDINELKINCSAYDREGFSVLGEWRNGGKLNAMKTVHTAVTVSGRYMKINMTVDGDTYRTTDIQIPDGYKGGFIELALNNAGTSVSNISLSESNFADYAYVGSDNKAKGFQNINDFYTVETNEETGTEKYIRNSNGSDSKGWGSAAYLYFGNYKNFELNFAFKVNENRTGEQYMKIAYGNSALGDGRPANGAGYITLGVSATKTDDAYTYKTNCLSVQRDGDSWFDANGTFIGGGKPNIVIDPAEEHLATVTVKDGILTVSIDDGKQTVKRSVDALYNGGFIGLGTNCSGFYFADVELTNLGNGEIAAYSSAVLRHSKQINNTSPFEAVDKYYTVFADDTGVKHFKRNSTSNDGDFIQNVAMLNVGNYKNFRMEFDYDYSEVTAFTENNIDNSMIWLNIGNARLNGGSLATGTVNIGIRQSTDGLINFNKNDGAEAIWWFNAKNGDYYRGGRVVTSADMKQHIVITVKDGFVNIKNGNTDISYALPDAYAGGYVTIGCKTPGIKFSEAKVTNLSSVYAADKFHTYYSDDMGAYGSGTTTATSGNLTRVKADSDWSWDGETLALKSAGATDINKKMSVAYLAEREYTDFELNFEYRMSLDQHSYVGFGSEMGKSWFADVKAPSDRKFTPNDGLNVMMLRREGRIQWGPRASYINGSDSGNWYFDDWLSNSSGILFTTEDEYYSYHTCSIRVSDNRMSITIDGKIQGIKTLDNYSGGYIFFAGNINGTTYRNISVTDITSPEPGTGYDIEGFTAYHSDRISDNADLHTPLTKVKASDYWNYDSNTKTVTRKLTAAGAAESDSPAYKTDWAQLTFNTPYENFEIEADVTNGYDAWGRMYIGMGAETPDEVFMQPNGGIAAHVYPNEARFNLAGNLWNTKAFNYEWRNSSDSITPNRTNHVRITVRNRFISLYLNGSEEPLTCWTFPEWYKGGYISFGTNSSFAAVSNIKINGIDALDTVKDTPLSGKSALFVGDSISVGVSDTAMAYSWGGRIGIKYGMDWVNDSHGGANMAEYADGHAKTIVEQIKLFGDRNFDYIVIEGGVNDAMNKMPLGTYGTSYDINDFDDTTFAGALETAFAYAKEKWPTAHIGYIVTFRHRWEAGSKENTDPYYTAARAICQKWGVPYLDLNGETVEKELKVDIADDTTYISDGIHPTAAGYELLTQNYIEPWMLSLKEWGSIPAVRGDLDKNGIMNSADLALFRKYLIGAAEIDTDYSEPDINGELVEVSPDVNGDTVFDIRDIIRFKKILADKA